MIPRSESFGNCTIVKGEQIRRLWEKGITQYLNQIPIDKAFHWEHLLVEDITTIQPVLTVCQCIKEKFNEKQRFAFLQKLATVIPNSHARNVLVQFYLSMINVMKDDCEPLISLIKFYPLAMTSINMFLRQHFISYFAEFPHKGEKDSEIIDWSKPYIKHLFECKDLFIATGILDWISQFRYRAVHEMLLTVASTLPPQESKPEYWIFLHKLLGIVVPGPPPTLVSSNRFASVLLSIGAAVSPGCPISPEQFVLMGKRMEYDMDMKPVLYANLSLTPGLIGLASYILLKYPTPAMLPFIENMLCVRQGANIHLFGCLLYPLSILGSISSAETRTGVVDIMTKILKMDPVTSEQRDYISQDDYSEKCIKTQSTLVSLKMGQVLSFIAEKGVDLVTKQMQKTTLTQFTATILCHCLVLDRDRPTEALLATFGYSDDSTNMTILTFLIIHIDLIKKGQVPQSKKFIGVYMRNISLLMKKSSATVLKKMIKRVFGEGGLYDSLDVAYTKASYQVMESIWLDHGGLVSDTFYKMLEKPKEGTTDIFIMVLVRNMCSSDRVVNVDTMDQVIRKYLRAAEGGRILPENRLVLVANAIFSLSYLCSSYPTSMNFNEVRVIVDKYGTDPELSYPVCFFYSEYVLQFSKNESEEVQEIYTKLWEYSQSPDHATASQACTALVAAPALSYEPTPDIEEKLTTLINNRHEYPEGSDELVAGFISQELIHAPAHIEGSIPNPAKKLLKKFRVKDLLAEKNLLHTLYSFTYTPIPNRQQHKKQMSQNRLVLGNVMAKFTDEQFNDAMDGIMLIEGWNHFMYEYFKGVFDSPSYQRRNKADIGPSLDALKIEIMRLVGEHQKFVLFLTIISTISAIHKLAVTTDSMSDFVRNNLSKDIGILRTLLCLNTENTVDTSKTNAILLLCAAFSAKIAHDIEDESLLKMLLEASMRYSHKQDDLVIQCAAVARGSIVHTYYKITPKSPIVKEAIQVMLDEGYYLGLTFCVDSFCNSMPISTVEKFVTDMVADTSRGIVSPDKLIFLGVLFVYMFNIDRVDEEEIWEFIAYLSSRINTVEDPLEQRYLCMVIGLINYGISPWQYNLKNWKRFHEEIILEYVEKCNNNHGAIPTLSLLVGFPLTNLVDLFDWGPSVEAVELYCDSLQPSLGYQEGKLCSLMIARRCELYEPTSVRYRSMPGSICDMVNELILSSLIKQSAMADNRRKLTFALSVFSHVKSRIPLSYPLQLLISIFTRTVSLQEYVLRFAGTHAKITSKHYFIFVEKFLSLSVYPRLALPAQKEIILQIPNFIQFISPRKQKYFFFVFLNETFWQGNKELRCCILDMIEKLLDNRPELNEIVTKSAKSNYFIHQNIHLLSDETIQKISHLMMVVGFYELKHNNLVAESQIVVEFIRSNYHVKEVTSLFFTRYLQVDLYTAKLARAVLNVIMVLSKDMAFNSLLSTMSEVKMALEKNPDNFMNPAIVCINTVMLCFVAYLNDNNKSLGSGLEHFLYLSETVEPQVNLDCTAHILKPLEPWSRINRLYIDVLPSDG